MHVDEQPSPFAMFKSSHYSFVSIIPFPHLTIGMRDTHLDGIPEHLKLVSILQVFEHPSPSSKF